MKYQIYWPNEKAIMNIVFLSYSVCLSEPVQKAGDLGACS